MHLFYFKSCTLNKPCQAKSGPGMSDCNTGFSIKSNETHQIPHGQSAICPPILLLHNYNRSDFTFSHQIKCPLFPQYQPQCSIVLGHQGLLWPLYRRLYAGYIPGQEQVCCAQGYMAPNVSHCACDRSVSSLICLIYHYNQ